MGIRIHKVLGYGFKKTSEKDAIFNQNFWKLRDDDPDIKPALIDWCEKNKELFDIGFFRAWLTNTGWCKDGGSGDQKLYISDFIHTSAYATEKETYPIIFSAEKYNKDWCRYDDIIDYIEAGRTMKDKVKFLKGGIYPHISLIDKRTGERAKEIPFSYGKLGKNQTYQISPEIVAFCNALNVFENSLFVYRLKPMLYTYWS